MEIGNRGGGMGEWGWRNGDEDGEWSNWDADEE